MILGKSGLTHYLLLRFLFSYLMTLLTSFLQLLMYLMYMFLAVLPARLFHLPRQLTTWVSSRSHVWRKLS